MEERPQENSEKLGGAEPSTEAPEVETSWVEAQRSGKPFQDADGTISYPSFRARPQPDFTLDPLHRGLLTTSVAVAVLVSVYTLLQIPSMPEEVPIHWSAGGTVSYGSRGSIAFPILLLLACVIGTAVMTRYPRIFSFPFDLTEHNVQVQYRNAVQMMVWTTVSLAIMNVGTALPWITGTENISLALAGLGVMVLSMVFFIRRTFTLR